MPAPTAAIILAGGQGSRLGGVRKADLVVRGERLLDHVLAAAEQCRTRVVVGYEDLAVPPGVLLTREDPPGSGPAAGVAAGMELVGEVEWVLTLACDLPGISTAVPALLEAAEKARENIDAISASSENRLEWLVSIHRKESLRNAIINQPGGVVNCSMRRLYSELNWEQVAVPPTSTRDIDTWEDFGEWEQKVGRT
ncbi:MAG TPA: molybdenum cofactor guanylyltransferase [Beutenbergiaceae bacterium]|nr:molybdenum cofactor guanylyltransferase [Beutenbergiaceae bacterium]